MQELESIIGRAMRQAAQSLGTAEVPEDVFWYAKQVSVLSCISCSTLSDYITKTYLHEQQSCDGH